MAWTLNIVCDFSSLFWWFLVSWVCNVKNLCYAKNGKLTLALALFRSIDSVNFTELVENAKRFQAVGVILWYKSYESCWFCAFNKVENIAEHQFSRENEEWQKVKGSVCIILRVAIGHTWVHQAGTILTIWLHRRAAAAAAASIFKSFKFRSV